MGDIIDKAQENDELFRQVSLETQLRKSKISMPHKARLAMTTENCEDCDEPIPAKRLKANPAATRCVECQTKYER